MCGFLFLFFGIVCFCVCLEYKNGTQKFRSPFSRPSGNPAEQGLRSYDDFLFPLRLHKELRHKAAGHRARFWGKTAFYFSSFSSLSPDWARLLLLREEVSADLLETSLSLDGPPYFSWFPTSPFLTPSEFQRVCLEFTVFESAREKAVTTEAEKWLWNVPLQDSKNWSLGCFPYDLLSLSPGAQLRPYPLRRQCASFPSHPNIKWMAGGQMGLHFLQIHAVDRRCIKHKDILKRIEVRWVLDQRNSAFPY